MSTPVPVSVTPPRWVGVPSECVHHTWESFHQARGVLQGALRGVLPSSVSGMSTARIARPPAGRTQLKDDRRTYTVPEVAVLVGISRSTAYECVRRGEIPSRRFGRRIVVLRHELDRLLNQSGAL